MVIAFLGFFETLGNILSEIFDAVLYPILEILGTTLFELATTLLEEIFATLWLTLLRVLLRLLEKIEFAFDLLAGSRYVLYYPNGTSGAKIFALEESMSMGGQALAKGDLTNFKQTYLIDLFTTQGPVARVYWLIMVVGLALVFIFTIFAISRSISSMALENKLPVGKVLTRAGKACVIFLLIPFMTLVTCRLSTAVLVAVERNLGYGDVTLANVMFCMTSMGDTGTGKPSPSFDDDVRSEYLYGDQRWADLDKVKSEFTIKNFNFLTGFIVIITLMIILMFTIFIAIKRLFECAMLFFLSPLFICVIPVDDGSLFKKWLNAYIGRVFSAMGSVFAMKLLVMFAAIISSSRIRFGGESGVDTVIRIFIILGGAYTAFKAQQTFLEILSPEAAQSNQLIGSFMMGATVGRAAQMGRGAITSRMARGNAAQKQAPAGAALKAGADEGRAAGTGGGNRFSGGGGAGGGRMQGL